MELSNLQNSKGNPINLWLGLVWGAMLFLIAILDLDHLQNLLPNVMSTQALGTEVGRPAVDE